MLRLDVLEYRAEIVSQPEGDLIMTDYLPIEPDAAPLEIEEVRDEENPSWANLVRKVTVCHYPTSASKLNPIEHRSFNEVSKNWAGRPPPTATRRSSTTPAPPAPRLAPGSTPTR